MRGARGNVCGSAAVAALAGALLAPGPGRTQESPAQPPAAPPTSAEVLAASTAGDWRALDPAETLYLTLDAGRVVIELAPQFAPRHVANIKTLVEQRYFDGLAVVRSQENYVVQWGDPAEDPEQRRSLGEAEASLPAEFERPVGDLAITELPDGDVYAPRTGFVEGFPVAFDPDAGRVWLAHCYAMVGVGRGEPRDSGSGAELYVVNGHSPRHLDHNVTLVGRVVAGMEHLSTLPRGHGPLGFYESAEELVPVRSIRRGTDLPASEREPIELLRTETPTFEAWIASRRTRRESWFLDPTGRIELCNVPLPTRERAPAGPPAGD